MSTDSDRLDGADRAALERALMLAERGRGFVEPNPVVGAVVYDSEGNVLAEGWHREYGEAHAERNALAQLDEAESSRKDLRLSITLEPCSSHGKQPPCTELLLQRRWQRVVVGTTDPDPRHRGAGVEKLRAAGVSVVAADDARAVALLSEFREALGRNRPEVLLKYACTLDGAWGPAHGDERQVSGPESHATVHRLRAHVDAILVGSGTVLADDPRLTARPAGERSLLRVVLDGRNRVSSSAAVFRPSSSARTLHVVGRGFDRKERPDAAGYERWLVDSVRDLAGEILPGLHQRGVRRLLVEGGPTVAASLLDAELVDRAWVFVAPRWYGGDARGPALGASASGLAQDRGARLERVERSGCDAWLQLRL